jgi:NADPH2:quinone reductase
MRAIRVHETGEPEVLLVDEIPDLQPGPGQVLVQVKAIGVNPVDTYVRSGHYASIPPLPYIPGSDAAGIVAAVGQGVRRWKPGQRVYTGHSAKGAYAEQLICGERDIFALPDNASFEAGASLGVPYATAYHALFQVAKVVPGEEILIHGASGGVGVAAVQLARAHGLTVCGTAGTEAGLEFVREQGAKYVLNHREAGYLSDALGATCGRGFDAIIEMAAHTNLGHDLTLLAPHGRVAIVGSRGEVQINPRDLMSRQASVAGVILFGATADETASIHAAIGAGLENASLQPRIWKRFPLEEAPAAHHAITEPGTLGKIILIP